jgi:NAD(P)-dependent dehydrogenase (short-subunit alcohol dehydrogenase family)
MAGAAEGATMIPSAEELAARSLAELTSLRGRVAVVTGGGAGIGRGIVGRLAEAGAAVVVADIGDTSQAVAEADAHGGRVVGRRLDVRDSAAISDMVRFTVDMFGSLDIWVNNAGIYPVVAALDTTDEQWDAVHDLNLRGAFIGAREAGREMVRAGHGGVIVNVVSIAAFRAAGPMHYVASKHGLNGLTKSLAVELGPHGIRVLSVAPGMIQTPGMDVRTEGVAGVHDEVAASLPLRRIGTPDDIARAVLFCASDLAAFMTGSAVVVDGGDLA